MPLSAKQRALALLACVCMLFSSCVGFKPVTEDLMRPPRLTEEQKAIEDALLSSVVAGDISFKYPQTGDYRSAFIFQDIDADGQEEALVFYITGGNAYARLSVLDHNSQGKWEAICELSGPHQNVDFISFAHLTGRKSPDILVGWSDPDSGDKRLEVYAYADKSLSRLIDGSPIYDSCLVDDLDQNGTEDLFLLTRNSGTREEASWIHLFAYDGYTLSILDELPLSSPLTGFAGVVAGQLNPSDPRRGIFIDEMQGNGDLVTEVFSLQIGELIPVINHSMVNAAALPLTEMEEILDEAPDDEAPVELPTLYELTVRAGSTALCADINGDGAIEIPTGRILPGYEDADTAEQLFLTEYNQLYAQSFQRVFSAVTNRTAGYQVAFPTSWVGLVTVVSQPENNEWRFIEYNEELLNPLEDLSGELMRIRVVSQKDYQDKFLENYTVLDTRGTFTYYGYIPEAAKTTLYVTMPQLQNELFSLL